ncbi:MAG: YebC/PmpR family DNA-binding transcriptional regulator [Bacillota bacterium]|jgi:YebC/PmpR family DNA-binding regulatory protein|nr:YebC/PmpR family DNA-binding transcriptional regulator [Candidatus Fermentithermobacillaceae bacterium]
MAGHSKWATIKRHKAKMDAARSNIISKAIREVMLAARQGGGNPDGNFRLKMAIEKAKASNVAMDSINRAIKRGTGESGEGVQVEELTYEGYGPGGTAVLVEAATDNRNRTAGEIRFIFSKHGGKLSEIGSVAWMFEQKGVIVIEKGELSEDDVLTMGIESGAEDVRAEEDSYVIYTAPGDLDAVRRQVEADPRVVIVSAELDQSPTTTVSVEGEDADKVIRLLEALDDHDDVTKVYSNFDTPEAEA